MAAVGPCGAWRSWSDKALDLELRFGKEGLRVLPRVEAVHDAGRLRELKEALLRVASLPELEAFLEAR